MGKEIVGSNKNWHDLEQRRAIEWNKGFLGGEIAAAT